MLSLMAEGRPETDKVAISWTDAGTDINYGALTKQFLAAAPFFNLFLVGF